MSNKNDSLLDLSELTAVTAIDGRYRTKTQELANYFSEFALIKVRIEVEIKYLMALSEAGIARQFGEEEKDLLTKIVEEFSLEDAEAIKKIESETRHDVKAVERFIRSKLSETSLSDSLEMIHFGLTSEDINNISHRLMLTRAVKEVLSPAVSEIVKYLTDQADKYKSTPMLARTHGQAAIPTTLGKELAIFAVRLATQNAKLETQKLTGKLNGAVGNFNALVVSDPAFDWITFSEKFVSTLGLTPNIFTNQINPYDDIAELFQTIVRINNILLGFNQDMWRYISDGWFILENKKGEVGSSTMPQKVNPIDFENSEGNLGLANALLEHLSGKLTVSRLQRDLSDSTVMRNDGVAFGYSLLSYKSTMTGLSRIKPNLEKIDEELNRDFAILTEGVQTILRKAGVSDSYSMVKDLSRGQHIKKEDWDSWVSSLVVDEKYKEEIRKLTPDSYIGLAEEITKRAVEKIRSMVS